jgi:hypothetical protein
VVENLDKFQRNTDVHNLNTRRKYDLHMPNTNLTKYQIGVYYTGIKLLNNLPPTIKSLNDIKVFKPALKDYLPPTLQMILPLLKILKLYVYLYVKYVFCNCIENS